MVLRVVRGAPDDVELAALVTALALLGTESPAEPVAEAVGWRARGEMAGSFRRPGAWRLSGLPR
ncbi:acyl-CoA carboxylase subunit epsilon [Amycolatopsis sp. FBCC-B4732]|uniref:acyl-CoA carboxylase epsilon subunit n=1 Tax=Amycolatopsis sp. FBCC-B4732 TaxID=3079339 RepID=UPI001FF2C98F|nr:acyl-CoA carboxylase epsilon subunit [Amycolatopsis sp. FBCC-B4732]UOX89485.1 acyl-CoA carboxylase subunit epsilon [Amycolatopsis sp. FBCC-B4732]